MKKKKETSEFLNLPDIEYFLFEEDFVEENVRCIPMIVRFKMDKAGIKLKLAEWSKFSIDERIELAKKICSNEVEAKQYNNYLSNLIEKHTAKPATSLEVDMNPVWADINSVPEMLNDKLREFGWQVSTEQWKGLSNLQRFALLKLCREGHENKNLPKAIKEFKLIG
jgi:hypothetical protein